MENLNKQNNLQAATTIELIDKHITEIKGLDALINLQMLYLYNNQIIEIKGLETLNKLENLFLRGNQITYTNINYLTLQIPLKLKLYIANDIENSTPRLRRGHEICAKVSKFIAAKKNTMGL